MGHGVKRDERDERSGEKEIRDQRSEVRRQRTESLLWERLLAAILRFERFERFQRL
jgi:hypothetical protein